MPSVVTEAMDVSIDSCEGRAMNRIDMALGYSSGPNIIMGLGSSIGHSDQHGTGVIMALRHQYITGGGPETQANLLPWVATWVMDFNTDPCSGRTMDPNMAVGSILGLNITLTLGDKQVANISLFVAALCSFFF